MKSFVIACACAVFGTVAYSQDTSWTLSRCIEHALDNNLDIRQGSIVVRGREIDLENARNSRLPGVSASMGENLSFGRGLTKANTYSNTNTTRTSISLGADMPVFSGMEVKYTIDQSRIDLASATADLDKAKDDMRVAVAQAYVQILYDMEILDVARNQVSIDSVQVVRLTAMNNNGKASKAELSSQLATMAQSRLSVTQAENNLAMAVLDLTQLLELTSPEGFTIVRPDISGLSEKLLLCPEEIYAMAVEVKPVIQAEKLKLDSAVKGIDIAKTGYIPTLSLSGGVGTDYYTSSGMPNSSNFFTELGNNFSQYVNLNLNIPIFSRFNTRNSVRRAQLEVRNQEIQLESTKKSLYKEIQQAYYNAVGAQGKFKSSQAAMDSASDAFELVQAKYENGKADITQYNEAKGKMVSSQSDLAQARYEYMYMAALLDFYQGKELTL